MSRAMRWLVVVGLSILPAPLLAEPADIVSGERCFFFDANGRMYLDRDARMQQIDTNNKRGNAVLTCQGHLPESAALPDRVMHYSYETKRATCLGGSNWKMTITPSGRAIYTCFAK